ncbi:MAG: hypothetical protein QY323_03000 [Patescibacteria group bacterium]|nr:MAG: hypothetical protein QY323_03000 [Patescibacteria group bacterium]
MHIFRVDPYKACRSASFLFGFLAPILPFTILVQGKTYSVRDFVLALVMIAATPLAVLVYYRCEYLVIDKDQLQITRLFRKTMVPISEISSLSYQFTGLALMLFVHYEENNAKQVRGFVVDFMSTKNIDALHKELLNVNSKIQINTDSLSKDAQERNAKRLGSVPKSPGAWLQFGAIWFFVGAVLQAVLLLMLVPKK